MTESNQLDERDLVARCQRGDQEAMQMFYRQHSKMIYAMTYRMTGSRADADDLVQDTFIRAFRYLPKFRGDSAVSTWLCRIAINLGRDLYKKQLRQTSEIEPGDRREPKDALAIQGLERALARLPEGYREVLVLHDVMEMGHGEIASILGIQEGTSKSQLHKARARMRELLTRP